MEFYETMAGKRFYGNTMPDIANSLKEIAQAKGNEITTAKNTNWWEPDSIGLTMTTVGGDVINLTPADLKKISLEIKANEGRFLASLHRDKFIDVFDFSVLSSEEFAKIARFVDDGEEILEAIKIVVKEHAEANPAITTHDEAALIVEFFENVLEKYGIKVPSPEDDDREDDNAAVFYGSVYDDLLSKVESNLIELLEKAKTSDRVVPYVFGDPALN